MFTLKYVPGAITGKPLNQKITNRSRNIHGKLTCSHHDIAEKLLNWH